MPPDEFDALVGEALDGLPEEFLERLDNVDVVVAEAPTPEQLAEHGLGPQDTLFGLYQGIPLTSRHDYSVVLPDKITIFQRPIEESCGTEDELVEQIRLTVMHEVAHFFGIDDDALDELGLG
jgi:predicted Zn-dependent protease with MMP-like domain